MGAYEMFGHALRGQKRYREALAYYERAHAAVRSRLTEKDAELGRLYGDMAITHHLLRDLDEARELYRKAEKIFQTAHASIGGDDSDEEVDLIRQSYMRSLKQLLEYHLIAAEDAGAAAEAEEVWKLLRGSEPSLLRRTPQAHRAHPGRDRHFHGLSSLRKAEGKPL